MQNCTFESSVATNTLY